MDAVKIGLPLKLQVASVATRPFLSTVEFISPSVEEKDGKRYIRVVALLKNDELLLRQDMTGFAEIDAGKRSLLNLSTRRLLRWLRVRFLV